jgi:hypothetical protein
VRVSWMDPKRAGNAGLYLRVLLTGRQTVLLEISFEPSDPLVRLGQRSTVRVGLRPLRRGQAGLGRVIAGPAPLHDMRRVQALPAQQGALVTVTDAGVLLGHHGQLVLTSEATPLWLVGKLGRGIAHRFIMGALHQHCGHRRRFLPGPVSPLRDGGLQQVSQVMLTEREPARRRAPVWNGQSDGDGCGRLRGSEGGKRRSDETRFVGTLRVSSDPGVECYCIPTDQDPPLAGPHAVEDDRRRAGRAERSSVAKGVTSRGHHGLAVGILAVADNVRADVTGHDYGHPDVRGVDPAGPLSTPPRTPSLRTWLRCTQ